MLQAIGKILAGLYLGYLAVVVLIIFPTLNFLPHWFIQKEYDRQLHSDIVLFNPFTMSLEARGVELPERNGEPFFSLSNAVLDLSVASLWQPGVVLDMLDIDDLFVHVKRLKNGQFNFSDLLPPTADSPEPAQDSPDLPGITIRDLDFDSRRITLTDEAREDAFSTHYDGLAIKVDNLSTVIEAGRPYRIDATAESGGTLHWEGHISIPESNSEGLLRLSNISLQPFWRFMEPQVDFRVQDGNFNLGGNYRINWRDTFRFKVDAGEFQINSLAIEPKSTETLTDTSIRLGSFTIAGIAVDGDEQHAKIDSVVLDELNLTGWSKGSKISLVDLLTPVADDSAQPPTEQEETAAGDNPQGEAGDWTAQLVSTRITNSSVRWQSEYTSPTLMQISPLTASLDNIHWPLAQDTLIDLALAINEQAAFKLAGKVDLGSGNGGINFTLDELPVPWFNPNLPAALNATITNGLIGVAGQVELAEFGPSHINAEGEIANFAGKVAGDEISLTSWDSVRWEDLAVDMERRSIELASLTIHNYSGRLHIYKDGSINTSSVWEQEVGEQADDVREEMNEEGPWSFDLPQVSISDSQIDFMDESLPLNFRTVIGDLNGTINGLGSDPTATAQVAMKGSVDGYAPVALNGTAEPLRTPPNLDLELTFDGMDLATLTPYSGTYAGYAIDRGILNLDLKYALEDSKLKGQNNVVIQQLKLGEKIESDKAVDVPLKLGLALLTDLNGVIDLKVPVNGDLDDPKFGLGSVIMGAFVNLIVKAATAPFALLGSLVGSEQDLQRVNFSSGSADLDEAASSTLRELSTALSQRPGLTLVVVGRLHPEADREKLQEQNLNERLLATGISQEKLDKKKRAWKKSIAAEYEALVTQGTVNPSDSKIPPMEQYAIVLENMQVSDSQLRELAEARARAVKTFLVNEAQLPADKAVIQQVKLDDKANIFSGAEMEIEV